MTLEEFNKKYLPVPANTPMSWIGAAAHSLRKWIGVKEAFARQMKFYQFGSKTCALCQKSADPLLGAPDCDRCPLPQFQDGMICSTPCSPYQRAVYRDNPDPLIAALKKTVAHLIKLESLGTPWSK